jgi:hypothetical protein
MVADDLAEAQVRFPTVPIVFCETRKLAQEWTYRFLGAALAHHHDHEHGDRREAELPAVGTVPSAPPTTAEVRLWARANGIEVPDRGRLRPEIHDAYRAANARHCLDSLSMPRLRQVPRADADSPIVKAMYDRLFGDRDPVAERHGHWDAG